MLKLSGVHLPVDPSWPAAGHVVHLPARRHDSTGVGAAAAAPRIGSRTAIT